MVVDELERRDNLYDNATIVAINNTAAALVDTMGGGSILLQLAEELFHISFRMVEANPNHDDSHRLHEIMLTIMQQQDVQQQMIWNQQPHPQLSSSILIRHPIRLSVSTSSGHIRALQDQEDDMPNQELAKAALLFNTALVRQLQHPYSADVPVLYRRSAAILLDIPDCSATFFLAAAKLNNVGVWCYMNGDTMGAKSCMEQLSVLLMHDEDVVEDVCWMKPVMRQMHSNILITLQLSSSTSGSDGDDGATTSAAA